MKKYSIPRQIWRVIYPLLIYFASILIAFFVGTIVVSVVMIIRYGTETDAADYALEAFLFEQGLWLTAIANVISGIVFVLMWRKIRQNLPKYENTKLRPLLALLIILMSIGLNYSMVSLSTLTNIVQYFPSFLELTEILFAGSFFMQIITAGIVAPIYEELLYRGIILNRLMSWMPKWVAVVIGSAVFGLMHLNLFQGLYAFFVGILLSMLYLRYRNLLVPIVSHIAFNMGTVILHELSVMGVVSIDFWALFAVSAPVTAATVYLMIRYTNAATLVQENEICEYANSSGS